MRDGVVPSSIEQMLWPERRDATPSSAARCRYDRSNTERSYLRIPGGLSAAIVRERLGELHAHGALGVQRGRLEIARSRRDAGRPHRQPDAAARDERSRRARAHDRTSSSLIKLAGDLKALPRGERRRGAPRLRQSFPNHARAQQVPRLRRPNRGHYFGHRPRHGGAGPRRCRQTGADRVPEDVLTKPPDETA